MKGSRLTPGNRRYRGWILFLSAIFLTVSGSKGMYTSEDQFEKIFMLIYGQHFTEAEKELRNSAGHLETLHYEILRLDLAWWKAISANKKSGFSDFENLLEDNLNRLKGAGKDNVLHELWCLTYALRLAALRNQLFPVMANLYKINHLIGKVDAKSLEPQDIEIFNIYKAVFNTGKSRFMVFNSKIKSESITTLENSLQSPSIIIQTISNYSLAKIYTEIEKSPRKAKIYYEQLCLLYPGNTIFINELKKSSDQ